MGERGVHVLPRGVSELFALCFIWFEALLHFILSFFMYILFCAVFGKERFDLLGHLFATGFSSVPMSINLRGVLYKYFQCHKH